MLGRSAKRRAVNSKSTPTLAAGLTRVESYELSLSLLNLEQFGQGGHSTFPAEGGALAAREKQLGRSRSEASTKLIHSLRWVVELERGGLGGGSNVRSNRHSFVRRRRRVGRVEGPCVPPRCWRAHGPLCQDPCHHSNPTCSRSFILGDFKGVPPKIGDSEDGALPPPVPNSSLSASPRSVAHKAPPDEVTGRPTVAATLATHRVRLPTNPALTTHTGGRCSDGGAAATTTPATLASRLGRRWRGRRWRRRWLWFF